MNRKRGAGEGSISKRKNGLWQGAVTIGRNDDGSQKRKYFYGKTRNDVTAKITEAIRELRKDCFINVSESPTLKEWMNTWLWIYKKNSLKQTTFEQYETLIRVHLYPALGNKKLTDLKQEHIQKLYNNMKKEGLSEKTIRMLNCVIHAAFEQAVYNNLASKNITQYVKIPKDSYKEMRVLDREEQKKLFVEAETDRMGAAVKFACMTGVRRGELLSLCWKDIDWDKRLIYVRRTLNRVKDYDKSEKNTKLIVSDTKTAKSRRVIPIIDRLYKILIKQKQMQEREKLQAGALYEDNDLVFATIIGQPIDPSNFNRTLSRMSKRAGINKVNPHSLRHTFATRSLEAGIDLKTVQEVMGHSSIKVTGDTYMHVMTDRKTEEMRKLNEIL